MPSFKYQAYISGDIIELYSFKTPQPETRVIPKSPGRSVNASTAEKKQKNRDVVISRARRDLRRLVNSNWNQWGCKTAFMTLTFRDNVTDISTANKAFKGFLDRLEWHYGDKLLQSHRLKYVCVPEFQQRGSVHFHLAVFNMPYINVNDLARVWGHGFIRLNAKDYNNLGSYMSKYMTKNSDDIRLHGQKSFFRSRGLKTFTQTKNLTTIMSLIETEMPLYNMNYHNEYQGDVTYQIYRVPREILYTTNSCIQSEVVYEKNKMV